MKNSFFLNFCAFQGSLEAINQHAIAVMLQMSGQNHKFDIESLVEGSQADNFSENINLPENINLLMYYFIEISQSGNYFIFFIISF